MLGSHIALIYKPFCCSVIFYYQLILSRNGLSKHYSCDYMKIVLFANTDWYLYNFRLSLARQLIASGHEVILLSPIGGYVQKLKDLGFRWLPAPMVRTSLNPLTEMLVIAWLVGVIRREKVDLVHGFTIKCVIYGALAAILAGNVPRVTAIAGLGYVFTSRNITALLLRPFVRMLLICALSGNRSRLILQNSNDKELLLNSGVVNNLKIRLIAGSGVDCERFMPRTHISSANALTVLLSARLIWDKGIKEYVNSSKILKAQGRDIRFILAGSPDSGNPDSVNVDTIKSWVDEGLIDWLGHVDDMPSLLSSIDIMVLPTFYGEGLPKSLIEGAASGVALVTTDSPGCREVVDHGVNGLLVPTRDSAALADAIGQLHDDPSLRYRLGLNAREKALANFDEKIIIEQTIAVYRELLPGKI